MMQDLRSAKQEPVKLLWTGGWDSTFRLLQLAVCERRLIQPYYLIDPTRRSAGQEVRVMEQIRDRLCSEYDQVRELILPTVYTRVRDIRQNDSITEAHRGVAAYSGIGEQYEWLARWCAGHGIEEIELCIHRDDKAHRAIEPYITRSGKGANTFCVFDSRFSSTDESLLFGYFRYPLFDLSKLDMKHIMTLEGLASYMDMTWFCHNPSSADTPCGVCSPCTYAIEEGLGYRIPLFSRGKYYVKQFFVVTLKRRSPLLFSLVKMLASLGPYGTRMSGVNGVGLDKSRTQERKKSSQHDRRRSGQKRNS